jgi:hypothetical protein
MSEKNWLDGAVHEDRAGMFKDTSTKELEAELAHLKKMGPHKEGTPQFVKMRQVLFALRARKTHGFKSPK